MDRQQLLSIMPIAGLRADLFLSPLNAAMAEFEINTPARQAAFLAQIAVESEELRALSENLNYSAGRLLAVFPSHFTPEEAAAYAGNPEKIANRVYANRNGNGPEASGDGWLFRGRGLIDTTGRANYLSTGQGIGLELIQQPDLLIMPAQACRASAWFWRVRGLNELADQDEFTRITERINGGLNGQTAREAYWAKAKPVLGV